MTENKDEMNKQGPNGISVRVRLPRRKSNYGPHWRDSMTQHDDLTVRRAVFVYSAARLAAIAAKAPIIPQPWIEREHDFQEQFLCVIERQCSEARSRSPEELHGSWMQAYFAMGWKYGETHDPILKTHPDLVPYADLNPLEQDKDSVFIAMCDIARLWIR